MGKFIKVSENCNMYRLTRYGFQMIFNKGKLYAAKHTNGLAVDVETRVLYMSKTRDDIDPLHTLFEMDNDGILEEWEQTIEGKEYKIINKRWNFNYVEPTYIKKRSKAAVKYISELVKDIPETKAALELMRKAVEGLPEAGEGVISIFVPAKYYQSKKCKQFIKELQEVCKQK